MKLKSGLRLYKVPKTLQGTKVLPIILPDVIMLEPAEAQRDGIETTPAMHHQTTFITTDHGLEAVQHHKVQRSNSLLAAVSGIDAKTATSAAAGQSKFKRAVLSIFASVFFILRLNTLLVTISGLVAYWVYDHEEWGLGKPLNIPLSIVSFGVFFPLGFVIGAVYRRRDQAALVIAALKAAALGLVMMSRDWDETYADGVVGANSSKPHPVALTADRSEGRGVGGTLFMEMRAVCAHFLDQVHAFLYHKNDETRKPIEREVYKTIHTLSVLSEQLRVQAGYAKGGEGGMSRSAQFVTYLIRHFEELRTWREYRSPYGLRYSPSKLVSKYIKPRLCNHVHVLCLSDLHPDVCMHAHTGTR